MCMCVCVLLSAISSFLNGTDNGATGCSGWQKNSLCVCVHVYACAVPMIPLSLLSKVELGLVIVPHGLRWLVGGWLALLFRVEQGLSVHADAVLLVRVEQGLTP